MAVIADALSGALTGSESGEWRRLCLRHHYRDFPLPIEFKISARLPAFAPYLDVFKHGSAVGVFR